MGWALLVLLLLPAGLFIWGGLRARRREIVLPEGIEIPPHEFPGEVVARLKPAVEELMDSGFTFALGRKERKIDGRESWQIVMSAAEGRVWGVLEAIDGTPGVQATMESYGSDGSVVLTRAGESFGTWKAPEWLVSEGKFGSALEQAEAHAARLTRESVPLSPATARQFEAGHDRMIARPLEMMGQSGWLRENENGTWSFPAGKLPQASVKEVAGLWSGLRSSRKGALWGLALVPDVHTEAAHEAEPVSDAVPAIHEEQAAPVSDAIAADDEFDEAVMQAIAATEAVANRGAARDGAILVADELAVESEKERAGELEEPGIAMADTASEVGVDDLPAEEGLERDWSLYNRSTKKGSWAYWFRTSGQGALWWAGLVGLMVLLSLKGVVTTQVVLMVVVASVLHEAGHAVAMLLSRCWDWSVFLLPVPHPMKSRPRGIGGGLKEVFVLLAGPLPGLAIGWTLLFFASRGTPFSGLVLDFAFAAILVNWVSLLPVRPLDGGRLLDVLLFRSLPGLRIPALIIGAIISAGLAVLLHSPLAGLLALFFLFGLPAANKTRKFVPWVRANLPAAASEERRIRSVLNVLRQRGSARLLKGPGWPAVVDEYEGLGRSRAPRGLAWIFASAILLLATSSVLILPALESGKRLVSWSAKKDEGRALASNWLPPETSTSLDEDLAYNFSDVAGKLANPGTTPSPDTMALVRSLRWEDAAAWIAEEPRTRQAMVASIARYLARQAPAMAEAGDPRSAYTDLSVALRIVIHCEPRHSLESWIDWLDLEGEILRSLETVSSKHPISPNNAKWFEAALARGPEPTGPKMAALLLRDATDFRSLVPTKDLAGHRGDFREEAFDGRKFLALTEALSRWVPLERLEQQVALANMWSTMESVHGLPERSVLDEDSRARLQDGFQRIRLARNFRQVALSGITIKRMGPVAESGELVRLRNQVGYPAEVVREGEKAILKLAGGGEAGDGRIDWCLEN